MKLSKYTKKIKRQHGAVAGQCVKVIVYFFFVDFVLSFLSPQNGHMDQHEEGGGGGAGGRGQNEHEAQRFAQNELRRKFRAEKKG